MIQIIKIRLGGGCNQNCSFCHSSKDDKYSFNPKLIPFIKYNHYDKINYGGGEPLLYWNYIKFFIDTFPLLKHHVVTNGSLFNEEMLEYTLKYNFRVAISLNEFTNISSKVLTLLSKVPSFGYGIVYTGAKTLDEIDAMIDEMNDKLHRDVHTGYNIMHTTNSNSTSYTKFQMDSFIKGIDYRIRSCIQDTLNNKDSRYDALTMWYISRTKFGRIPGCCHYKFTSVSLDGRLMECPYDKSYFGTIEDDLMYPKYNTSNCYTCDLKNRCESCYKSKNSDECYILTHIYRNFNQALMDYNITRHNLYNTLLERSTNRI